MIEDEELRSLFDAECQERFQNLDQGLLTLEKTPDDQKILQDLFREAHSLKGTARMLALSGLEKTAHAFEDALGSVKKGEIKFSSDLSDAMSLALGCMRNFAREAVGGEPADISPEPAIQKMKRIVESGDAEEPRPAEPRSGKKAVTPLQSPLAQEKISQPVSSPPAPPAPARKQPEKAAPGPSHASASDQADQGAGCAPLSPQQTAPADESYHVATIRVEPRKLDQLLNQVGELAVTRTRFNQRLNEADEIKDLLDDWNRARRKKEEREPGRTSTRNRDLDEAFFDRLTHKFQQLHQYLLEDNQTLEMTAREVEDGVKNLRLLPLGVLFSLFPRVVRDLCRDLGKNADLVITGEDTTVDKFIIEELKSPLTHLLRNAVHHGLESPDQRVKAGKSAQGALTLSASRTISHVMIEVSDDGRGLDVEAIKKAAVKGRRLTEGELNRLSQESVNQLIFNPGLSTCEMITDISGRGVGLDAVKQKIAELKGTVDVHSRPGLGCTFSIRLPISLTTSQVFIVKAAGRQFALPLDFTSAVLKIREDDIFSVEGRETIQFQQRPLSIIHLADLLGMDAAAIPAPEIKSGRKEFQAVIITNGEQKLGLIVDELLDQIEIVIKPHGKILKKVRNISGASILGTGEVCLVLDIIDLISAAAGEGAGSGRAAFKETLSQERTAPPRILLAEDSITTRTQEKRILESNGYQVVIAVDGQDALNKLQTMGDFDGVVSDIEMPNLTGLELTERIRSIPAFEDLPVILVSSLSSDEDRRRGLEAGADAYMTKPTFDQDALLDALRRLL